MNDDITGVNENPVGLKQAFHGHLSVAYVFEFFPHFSGQGGHLTGGPSTGDDHEIGHGRLTGKINDHNILGFVVIEYGFNQFKQFR
jgi:hypothetical protein